MGRKIGLIVVIVVAVLLLLWLLGLFSIDQTQEGAMPQVNVEGGALPAYDADVADVDVGTRNETVEVPVIDVEPAR